MDFKLWLAFLAANLLTSLAPGPSAMAAMNSGLAHGARAVWCLAGLQLALLLQLLLVALGAGALLATSQFAFQLLCWAGAVYLIWLGLGQIFQSWASRKSGVVVQGEWPVEGLLWRGMLVNLSNPKAILFMVALVPHFIDKTQPLMFQYLIIALTMCSVDVVVMGGYAGLAARLRPWLEAPGLVRWRNTLFGTLFVIFGLFLVGAKRES